MDPTGVAELTLTDFGMIGLFAGGIIAQWRANSALVSRMMDRQEALVSTLTGEQNKATAALADSVHRVETAVVRSDTANVAALGSLKESVNARLDSHEGRHEKHEAKFVDHDGRIKTLDGALALHEHRIKVIESSDVWTRKS